MDLMSADAGRLSVERCAEDGGAGMDAVSGFCDHQRLDDADDAELLGG